MKAATESAGPYKFHQEGDDYVFVWDEGAVEIRLSNIIESRGDTNAELKVSTNLPPSPGCLEWGRVNLSAMTTRSSLAKSLSARLPFDWQGALLQASHKAVQLRREGEPIVNLASVPPRETRWLLYPFIEHGGPTILFADGGVGKSVLALIMAYSVATGENLLGNPQGPPQNVLYLDWETDAQTHSERLQAIHNAYAFGAECPAILYKRMSASLADSAERVRKEVTQRKIALIIIDSLSLAVGGGMALEESATATAFFSVLRTLNTCALAISHVSKATVAGNGNQKASPFGSAFFRNSARTAWYVESIQEEGSDESVLRFEHVKSNNGRYQRQRGYQLNFDNVGEAGNERLAGIRLSPIELSKIAGFASKLSWSERIAKALAHGNLTTSEVARELDEEDEINVSKRLSDEKKKGNVVRLPDSTWGLVRGDVSAG